MRSKKQVMKDVNIVLRTKIIIERFTKVTNNNGFQEEKWIPHKTVWSAVNNLYGKEYWEAKSVQSETTTKFLIRYLKDLDLELNPDVTKKYRINFKGRGYNITFIDNIRYENRFMEIKANMI